MLEPGRYEGVPAHTLLESAAHGYIAVDHRLLHAILDDPESALPDLLRFAGQNHEDDPVDLELELIDLFRHIGTPEALPFFVGLVRRNPNDVSDDLVEAFVQMGSAAVDPLLTLLAELKEQDAGDVPFVLSALHVRDSRILETLIGRLASDPLDAALCLDIYGDPAAIPALEAALERLSAEDLRSRDQIQSVINSLSALSESVQESQEAFNIWELYPKEEEPDYRIFSQDERLAMLESSAAKLRAGAALTYVGSEPPAEVAARLLELARTDPDLSVRGSCWEALRNVSDEPKICSAMMGVLRDPEASIDEKSGAAVALAWNYESNLTLTQAIEALYDDPRSRAKALRAMGNSLDRRFAEYPPRHLDDPDSEIKRQAILGIGYLSLTSEAPRLESFFTDEDYRLDALFAYALSMPGETSPGRANAMLKKIEGLAGGLDEEEEKLVKIALDERLKLRGKRPVFSDEL